MHISLWLCLLQQSWCCAAVLIAAGGLCGLPRPGLLRLASAGLLGGLLTVAALAGPVWLHLPLLTALLLLPLLVWPGLRAVHLLRLAPAQLLMGLLLSGSADLAGQWLPMLLALPLCLLGLWLLPRWQRRRPTAQYATLTIRYAGKHARTTALIDSGNLLRDPLTGLPVIVLSQATAARLGLSPHELHEGMRFLRIRTAAGAASMIVLHADAIQLETSGRQQTIQALLGISPDASAAFSALVPASCLRSEQEGIFDDHDF